jgi:hypothetical protein
MEHCRAWGQSWYRHALSATARCTVRIATSPWEGELSIRRASWLARLAWCRGKSRNQQYRVMCADVEVDIIHDNAHIACVVLGRSVCRFYHVMQISGCHAHGAGVAIFRGFALAPANVQYIDGWHVAPHETRTKWQLARLWAERSGIRCATLHKPLRLPLLARVLVLASVGPMLPRVRALTILAAVQNQGAIVTYNPVSLDRALNSFDDVCTHWRVEEVGGHGGRV